MDCAKITVLHFDDRSVNLNPIQMTHPPKVLIVDDQPINIKILQRKLERNGIEVLLAYNGIECLEVVARTPPDLILLDVMMPEMDGIETCRRLRAMPETETIPVIFITAKSSKVDRLTGLDTGAVDYIAKPIDLDETLARVRTQLRLQRLNRENLELQERLSEAREAALLGSVTQGIAHNLNNLLGVVIGYLELIRLNPNDDEKTNKNLDSVERAVKRMVDLIGRLGNLTSSRRVPTAPVAISDLVSKSIERLSSDLISIPDHIEIEHSSGPEAEVQTNAEMFENLFCAIIRNAWESYDGLPSATRIVRIRTALQKDRFDRPCAVFEVEDEGTGIPDQIFDSVFDPFFTTKRKVGRGMGLTIAKHAAQNLGGEVTLTQRKDSQGTLATVRILARPETELLAEDVT